MVNLETTEVVLAYGSKRVVDGLDFVVPEGKITVIIGPNGSGKSTCLRGLARVLRPAGGVVLLNGRDIHDQSTKVVAKQIGILPQGPTVPAGVTSSTWFAVAGTRISGFSISGLPKMNWQLEKRWL